MGLDSMVHTMLERLQLTLRSETVIGDPITVGNKTIIPVTKVTFGFGAGGGEKQKEADFGGGSGGGATIEPVAFICISGDDVSLMAFRETETIYDKLLDAKTYDRLIESFKKIRDDYDDRGQEKSVDSDEEA